MGLREADRPNAWPDKIARCKRDQVAGYFGTQRPPKLPDEAGAVTVKEGMGGTRLLFYPEPTSKDWLRVEIREAK